MFNKKHLRVWYPPIPSIHTYTLLYAIPVNTHTYIDSLSPTLTCTYMQTYVLVNAIHANTHTHKCIHTHTHTQILLHTLTLMCTFIYI